jgi:Tol biopolymer transport system component
MRRPAKQTLVVAGVLCGAALSGCGSDSSSGDAAAPTGADTSISGSSSPSALVDDSPGTLLMSDFDDNEHAFGDTFTIRPDGSGRTVIAMPGPEGGGRWSHAGTDIAVMTTRDDGRVGTAVLAPDGTVKRVLDIADPTLNLVCTVWSPDDTHLACEGWDDKAPARAGIYTVRSADGGGLQRVTTAPKGQSDLPGDFSPDGSRLVFDRGRDEKKAQLMEVAVAGGDPTALGDSVVEDPGRFSPDGQTILTSGLGDLLELSTSGEVLADIHQDASDGAYLFGPVWSPDGSRIAFSRSTSGQRADVWTALPNGSDQRRVTSTPASNEIRVEWGPT